MMMGIMIKDRLICQTQTHSVSQNIFHPISASLCSFMKSMENSYAFSLIFLLSTVCKHFS